MAAVRLPSLLGALILLSALLPNASTTKIDRRALVSRYNPSRTGNFSDLSTPMQVGNGNFAFGADPTGLQTILPFATMSSWGWKNDSLPANRTWQDVADYRGVSWDNHGRPVEYDFGGDPLVEQWLTANPNRVNLGRIGLALLSGNGTSEDVPESALSDLEQRLDLWTGNLTSSFLLNGQRITVQTFCAQDSDTVGVTVASPLIQQGRLSVS
ncbi:hypothetical protein EWM64_g3462, partial [Hericium alpestre]